MVHKVGSAAGAVTVVLGTGTINSLNALAQTYYVLANPGQYAEFSFDGTNWWVTGDRSLRCSKAQGLFFKPAGYPHSALYA
jgi:hypothetical protein